MAIESAYIMAALKTQWDATSAITTLATGGFHAWAAAESVVGTASAYAVCSIEEGAIETNSGSVIVQSFMVTIAIYSGGGVTDAAGIRTAVATAFNRSNKSDFTITGVDKVLDLHPMPRTQELQQRKSGTDVLLTAHIFEMTLQGTD